MNNELIQKIKEYPGLFTRNGKLNSNILRKDSVFFKTALYFNILEETKFLSNAKLQQRLWHIFNDTTMIKCAECGINTNFISINQGYHTYCSWRCSTNSESVKLKSKATKTKKYNNPCYNNPEKTKKTLLERYGAEHALQLKEFKDKALNTKLDRYGDENYNNREKALDTNFERFGMAHYKQQHFSKHIQNILFNKTEFKKFTDDKSAGTCAVELSVDYNTIVKYAKLYNVELAQYKSRQEQLIADYLDKLNIKYLRNTRKIIKPKELDFYLTDYKLAIEFNGVFWHNPNFYGSKLAWFLYHQNKIEECNLRGIKLIHIWENYDNIYEKINNAINNNIYENNLLKTYERIYAKD